MKTRPNSYLFNHFLSYSFLYKFLALLFHINSRIGCESPLHSSSNPGAHGRWRMAGGRVVHECVLSVSAWSAGKWAGKSASRERGFAYCSAIIFMEVVAVDVLVGHCCRYFLLLLFLLQFFCYCCCLCCCCWLCVDMDVIVIFAFEIIVIVL